LRLYLDTSLVVSALLRDEASETVNDWLATRSAIRFVVSDWVVAEFSAALSRKRMMRQISEKLREEAQLTFDELAAGELTFCRSSEKSFTLQPNWLVGSLRDCGRAMRSISL
jgi:predicted nucleic acid-binding protein